jgi:hypothetical protein
LYREMQMHAKAKRLCICLYWEKLMPDRNAESGQYTKSYPVDQFVRALDEFDEPAGTKAVQEAVGCEYRTAIAKLHELNEQGAVDARRIGNAYLWSVADVTPNMDDNSESQPEAPTGSEDGVPTEDGLYDPTKEWE